MVHQPIVKDRFQQTAEQKWFDVVKKRLRRGLHLPPGRKDEELRPTEISLHYLLALTGIVIITVVILRSLYLMFMKPDGY